MSQVISYVSHYLLFIVVSVAPRLQSQSRAAAFSYSLGSSSPFSRSFHHQPLSLNFFHSRMTAVRLPVPSGGLQPLLWPATLARQSAQRHFSEAPLGGVRTSRDPQHSHDADDGGVDGQGGLLYLLQGDAHDGQQHDDQVQLVPPTHRHTDTLLINVATLIYQQRQQTLMSSVWNLTWFIISILVKTERIVHLYNDTRVHLQYYSDLVLLFLEWFLYTYTGIYTYKWCCSWWATLGIFKRLYTPDHQVKTRNANLLVWTNS